MELMKVIGGAVGEFLAALWDALWILAAVVAIKAMSNEAAGNLYFKMHQAILEQQARERAARRGL